MLFGRRRQDQQGPAEDPFVTEAISLLDPLYGTAVRLTRDADRAQDLVQDTYLKAFRARARFQAGTNLKAWLFTILHNTWRNRQRDFARARVEFDSAAMEQAADDGAGGASTSQTPEALLLEAAGVAELREALDQLPEAFRSAVWLRDVEDLSYQEIAETLAIPIGTVMSRISRGRRMLHAHLLAGREAVGVHPDGR